MAAVAVSVREGGLTRVVGWVMGSVAGLLLLGGAGNAKAISASGGLRAQGSDTVLALFDGNDFEIFRLKGSDNSLTQITDNDYDDLAPRPRLPAPRRSDRESPYAKLSARRRRGCPSSRRATGGRL